MNEETKSVTGTSPSSDDLPALPDRLSTLQSSPHFDEAVLAQEIGIRFNGKEKTNVCEYCISEGWIKVEAGKSKDRHGNPLTVKLKGAVEPYYKT